MKSKKLKDIEKLYANIIASKKQSVADCPTRVLNPVYMAIRKFKHDGYIKKLQEKAVQKETEKYVLK